MDCISFVTLTNVRGNALPTFAWRIAVGHTNTVAVLVELQATLTHIWFDATSIGAVIALWDASTKRRRRDKENDKEVE